jgi:flavin reductase (DIM6/NTAB) family NADH-FMN oxidoreductase RutF
MRTFDPKDHPIPFVHNLLLGGVVPRPIALVGTMDKEGRPNLSPFSFYNAFGANPPVVVVSPSFSGKDGTPKHTFENILDTKEFTVSAVSFSMVEQISLASSPYPRGVDEFIKAGFSKLPSERIKAPGVSESPFVMECRLMQYVDTGGKPASGNLLIGEVVMFHVRDSAFEHEKLDPHRLDLVARMGGEWYCRASGDALFRLPKPRHVGIGIDALPEHIRTSFIFTGNDLAKLAGVETLPDAESIRTKWKKDLVRVNPAQLLADMFDVEQRQHNPRMALLSVFKEWKSGTVEQLRIAVLLQQCAQSFLLENEIDLAWECAIISESRAVEELTLSLGG